MKAYASNASYIGKGIDLQDSDNASAKIDWVAMLQQMSQHYLQSSQTYAQYLDCNSLASKLENWSNQAIKNDADNTEPTFQIGGQSYTQEELKNLLERIDKEIDVIKEEQTGRFEKQQAEKEITDEQIQELLADKLVSI